MAKGKPYSLYSTERLVVNGRGHNRGVADRTLEPRLLGAGLRRKGGAAPPPGVVYGI